MRKKILAVAVIGFFGVFLLMQALRWFQDSPRSAVGTFHNRSDKHSDLQSGGSQPIAAPDLQGSQAISTTEQLPEQSISVDSQPALEVAEKSRFEAIHAAQMREDPTSAAKENDAVSEAEALPKWKKPRMARKEIVIDLEKEITETLAEAHRVKKPVAPTKSKAEIFVDTQVRKALRRGLIQHTDVPEYREFLRQRVRGEQAQARVQSENGNTSRGLFSDGAFVHEE